MAPGGRRHAVCFGGERGAASEVADPRGREPQGVEIERQLREGADIADELDKSRRDRDRAVWSHMAAVAAVAAMPHPRTSSPACRGALLLLAATSASRRQSPSVVSTASPSSSRSSGRGGPSGCGGPGRRGRSPEALLRRVARLGRQRTQAVMYVSRASSAQKARACAARFSSSGGASLPRPEAKASVTAEQVRACALGLVKRPVLQRWQRAREQRRTPRLGGSPAPLQARAQHVAPGPTVSATARWRKAAAAATPPRACARPAERSSSAATSSSGPGVARARCQARRSGSVRGRWLRRERDARGAVLGGGRAIGGGPHEWVRELDAPTHFEQTRVHRRVGCSHVDAERLGGTVEQHADRRGALRPRRGRAVASRREAGGAAGRSSARSCSATG